MKEMEKKTMTFFLYLPPYISLSSYLPISLSFSERERESYSEREREDGREGGSEGVSE